MIRAVIDSLLVQYISNPFLTYSGGSAVPGRMGAVAGRPPGKIHSSAQLLFDIEMTIYEQKIFSGPPMSNLCMGGLFKQCWRC